MAIGHELDRKHKKIPGHTPIQIVGHAVQPQFAELAWFGARTDCAPVFSQLAAVCHSRLAAGTFVRRDVVRSGMDRQMVTPLALSGEVWRGVFFVALLVIAPLALNVGTGNGIVAARLIRG